MNYLKYAIIVLIILCGYLIIRLNMVTKDAKLLDAANKQNLLALNSQLEIYRDSTHTSYRRIAVVESLKDSLTEILKQNKETILSQQKYVIQLKTLLDSSTAVISTGELISDSLNGKILEFNNKNKNNFYEYNAKITLGNPSICNMLIKFSPFSIITHITRNDKGIWSGYVTPVEKWANDYINIKDNQVIIDADNYVNVENEYNKFKLSLYLGGGVYITPQTFIHIGGGIEINNKHLLYYSRGIGTNFNYINYSYKFNIIN